MTQSNCMGGETIGDTLVRLAGLIDSVKKDASWPGITTTDWKVWLVDAANRMASRSTLYAEPTDVPSDPELAAMCRAGFMIEQLEPDARRRTVDWLTARVNDAEKARES